MARIDYTLVSTADQNEQHASGLKPSVLAKETGLSRMHVYRLTKDLPAPGSA